MTTTEPNPPTTRIRHDSELLRLLSSLEAMAHQLGSVSTGWIAAREARRRAVAAAPSLRAAAADGARAPAGGHSDPTLGAVLATADRRDRLDLDLAKELAALEQAHELVRVVKGKVLAALAPPPAERRPVQLERRRCKSCARAGLDIDIDVDRYADYCRYCGRFKSAEGRVRAPGRLHRPPRARQPRIPTSDRARRRPPGPHPGRRAHPDP